MPIDSMPLYNALLFLRLPIFINLMCECLQLRNATKLRLHCRCYVSTKTSSISLSVMSICQTWTDSNFSSILLRRWISLLSVRTYYLSFCFGFIEFGVNFLILIRIQKINPLNPNQTCSNPK